MSDMKPAFDHEWTVAVLVDEAHNLLDRARTMYSAVLSQARFNEARISAPAALEASLRRLHRAWREVSKEQSTPYTVLSKIPERFAVCLNDTTAAITTHLAEAPGEIQADLLRFYFDERDNSRVGPALLLHSENRYPWMGRP